MPSASTPRRRLDSRCLSVLTLLGMLLAPASSVAQVNVEALRTGTLTQGRSGSLGGDVTIQTGNVDFVALDLRAQLYDVTATQTRMLVGNGGLGFLARSRFSSSGLVHYRMSFTAVNPRFSPEWYVQSNYDRAQLLTFRVLGGAGVRSAFASGAWGQFGAGTGVMLEYERLALPDTAVHADRTLELRSSSFLTLRIVPTETLVITSTTYLQPAVTDPGDFRALENMRISASVTETLALTISFDLRHDSRPPDGIAKLDTRLRTGVTYTY